MRTILLLSVIAIHLNSIAQENSFSNYVFVTAPPPNAYLLRSGNNIVTIWQDDAMNISHIWTSFDSNLSLITRKKLVTPNATGIIRQSYYETATGIIRVDQFIAEQSLHVSIYCFDSEGNIINKQQLTHLNEYGISSESEKPSPFITIFSKDKKSLVLLHQAKASNDQMIVSAIQTTTNLSEINKKTFPVSFDPEFQYVPVPVLADDGTLIFSVADKFTSYRLGSTIECYILEAGQLKPSRKEFKFPKRKIKDPHFHVADSKISVIAFFSDGAEKNTVAGLLQGSFDYKNDQWLAIKEYRYKNDVKRALKGIYGQPVSTNMILNNLSILPNGSDPDKQYKYAILLPEGFNEKINNRPGSSARVPSINTTSAQERLTAINNLIGLQPAGFSSPISNFGQAQNYAVTNPNVLPLNIRNPDYNYGPPDINNKRVNREEWNMPKNLLYFALDSAKEISSYKFSKMRPTSDPGYSFTAYSNNSSEYYCIYYHSKGLRKPYLNKVSIDHNGGLTEKNIFNQPDKIFDQRYPFIIKNNKLIAFYRYKETGDVGIISISL
jgi:hypothetical protein